MADTNDVLADTNGAPGRRSVLAGIGVAGAAAVLAGCGGSGNNGGTGAQPPGAGTGSTGSTGGNGANPTGTGAAGGGSGGEAITTAEIPVGGGKIFEARNIVVTQPAAGQFKAFSATCTHQGCQVASIQGGTIHCPCHGSQYSIADGSVKVGPAFRSLAAMQVTVTGNTITVS